VSEARSTIFARALSAIYIERHACLVKAWTNDTCLDATLSAIVTLTIFVLIGISISGSSEILHRTRRRLVDSECRGNDEPIER